MEGSSVFVVYKQRNELNKTTNHIIINTPRAFDLTMSLCIYAKRQNTINIFVPSHPLKRKLKVK